MSRLPLRCLSLIVIVCLSISVHALTKSQKEIYKEVERQLEDWKDEGRVEDIKLISSHKQSLAKQVKAGEIDLQAIVDEHNYKHKDGKYYGQVMPTRSSRQSSSKNSNKHRSSKSRRSQEDKTLEVFVKPKYDQLPASNRPVGVFTELEESWTGFPMMLTYTAVSYLVFPNGYEVHCADWDPRYLDPTPESVGTVVDDCKVEKTKRKEFTSKKFMRGQTIDIDFGNVSASSTDMGLGSSSRISGSTLRMNKKGEIVIGKFSAFSINSSGNGAGGGKRRRGLRGHYELDGHIIKITTTDGDVHTGFISWESNEGSNTIDRVFVNGEHFWNRKKGKKKKR